MATADIRDGLRSKLENRVRSFAQRVETRVRNEHRALSEQITARRSSLGKRYRKTLHQLRADALRKNLDKQLAQLSGQMFGAVGLATKRDVDKLSKKLNSISRKINSITAA